MLVRSDREFVPPLSERSSTLDKNLKASGVGGGIDSYYREMNSQHIMVAILDGEILGFVSYRENYVCDYISDGKLPNIYVSTLILKPEARGKNLTKLMYAHLFDTVYPDRNVFTRTWSQNFAHTKILSDLSFSEIERIKNDRGEGIDTVYYMREHRRVKIYR